MDFIKNLSKAKIAAIIGGGFLTLLFIGFMVFNITKPTMVPLYGDLSPEDVSLVTSKLQSMGKVFTADKDGKTIMVPVSDVLPLRMQLAQDGIPSSSKIAGYELFDKSDIIGTSQFVNNVNVLRALEGELVRTINSLSEVEQSRVHLVLPKTEMFSKTGPEPSASVFIKIKHGCKLSGSQINGIAHLVATAVPGLNVSNVTIIDQNGKPLKIAGSEENDSITTIGEYKSDIESKLKKAIESIVERHVGYGKVQANVVADIDFDKIVVNTEDYNPNSQVVRSERNTTEKDIDTQMDKNVSVSTNIPNFLQKKEPSSLKEHNRSDNVTNYEISKTITNKVIQWGALKQISVAVLVDGIYEWDKNTKRDVYKRDRTPEELNKIRQLVSAAVGIDESRGDKIEIMNLPFANENVFAADEISTLSKYDLSTLAQFAIVVVVLILAALLLLRPLTQMFIKKANISGNHENKKTDYMSQSLSEQINEMNKKSQTEDDKSSNTQDGYTSDRPFAEKQYEQLLRYLNDISSENIDSTIKVLRNWMIK